MIFQCGRTKDPMGAFTVSHLFFIPSPPYPHSLVPLSYLLDNCGPCPFDRVRINHRWHLRRAELAIWWLDSLYTLRAVNWTFSPTWEGTTCKGNCVSLPLNSYPKFNQLANCRITNSEIEKECDTGIEGQHSKIQQCSRSLIVNIGNLHIHVQCNHFDHAI